MTRNRNRKKHNKATSDVEETPSLNQKHATEQNHQNHVSCSKTEVSSNEGVQNFDADMGRHHADYPKDASLEKKIKQLEDEKATFRLKGIALEEKVKALEIERDTWAGKEGSLREKINCLEREMDRCAFDRNSKRELIATLNDDNRRLQMQVMELEESRNIMLQENQRLMKEISVLESNIQSVVSASTSCLSTETRKDAPENEDLNVQIEAACSLVDKLVIENSELVQKVNQLHIKLEQLNGANGVSSSSRTNEKADVANRELTNGKIPELYERTDPAQIVPPENRRIGENTEDPDATRVSSETSVSGEIVQIPLDEGEIKDSEARSAEIDEDGATAVPLTDAPLIGAPFRLISFFAHYVSGADLVNKSSCDPQS